IPAFMVVGFTAIKAIFWATIVAWAASYLRRDTSLRPHKLVTALANGSRQILNIAVTTAAAGIIVGVVNLTGLGLRLSDIIIGFAGGNLILTLIYSAIALWVLGLALPITSIIGLATVAAGINGWLLRKTTLLERIVLVIAGILFIYPTSSPDFIAAVMVAAVVAFQTLTKPAPQTQ